MLLKKYQGPRNSLRIEFDKVDVWFNRRKKKYQPRMKSEVDIFSAVDITIKKIERLLLFYY